MKHIRKYEFLCSRVYKSKKKGRKATTYYWLKKGSVTKPLKTKARYASAEFEACYQEALADLLYEKKAIKRKTITKSEDHWTLGGIWKLYKECTTSKGFARLAKVTQSKKCARIEPFILKNAHRDWRQIEPHMVVTWHANKQNKTIGTKGGVEAANRFVGDLSGLLEWATHPHREWKKPKYWTNPTKDVQIKYASDGFVTWEPEHIKRIFEFYKIGSMEHLVFTIFWETGFRVSDVLDVGFQHLTNEQTNIRKKLQKTGVVISLPYTSNLRDSVEAFYKNVSFLKNNPTRPWAMSSIGKPFASSKSLSNYVKLRCEQAGLPKSLSCHGIRKAKACHLAAAGATGIEMQAFFGWQNISEAKPYLEKFEKEIAAKNVTRKEQIWNKKKTA